MNQEERQVITDIFERLRQVADQPRDPEAERLVAEKVSQQPYAPYAMAQAIYVQEQALANLDAEAQQLRGEVERLRRQPQGGGGFLSSIFGGGSQQADPRQEGQPWSRPSRSLPGYGSREDAPATGPWGGSGGAMQPRAGGGFLQNALATAAGVAGGVMIANALSHAFGGSDHASTHSLAGSGTEGAGDTSGITDSLYQDASATDADPDDDFGGDAGDGGDWT